MNKKKLSLIVPCDKLHDIRIQELDLENESIKKQNNSLKIALEKFTIERHSLYILIGSQRVIFCKKSFRFKEYKKENIITINLMSKLTEL